MKKTNIDSPFYRTMGRIGDLVLANVLWLVCSLPIITAGASTLGLVFQLFRFHKTINMKRITMAS